eukprot:248537-Rhodomonas_salina.1
MQLRPQPSCTTHARATAANDDGKHTEIAAISAVEVADESVRRHCAGYTFEEKRFIAASSWDRKITVWLDAGDDSGTVTPFQQMQVAFSMLTCLFFPPLFFPSYISLTLSRSCTRKPAVTERRCVVCA